MLVMFGKMHGGKNEQNDNMWQDEKSKHANIFLNLICCIDSSVFAVPLLCVRPEWNQVCSVNTSVYKSPNTRICIGPIVFRPAQGRCVKWKALIGFVHLYGETSVSLCRQRPGTFRQAQSTD